MEARAQTAEFESGGSTFLSFTIGEVCYALPIDFVIEIIGVQPITMVPNVPSYIRGVINLRGKIIPVMDVRLRFDMALEAYHDRTCIIVVEVQGSTVGLVVDAVTEVLEIPTKDIERTTGLGDGVEQQCVTGLGKVGSQVKLILDARKLLRSEGALALNEAMIEG